MQFIHKSLHEGKAHSRALQIWLCRIQRLHGLLDIRYSAAEVLHRYGQAIFLNIRRQVQKIYELAEKYQDGEIAAISNEILEEL